MEQSSVVLSLGLLPPRRFRADRVPKRKRGVQWIGYGLALVVFFVAMLWTGRALLPSPEESVIVVEGQVEIVVDIEALVVREERVTHAPFAGTVKRLVSDGERVRLDADLIELYRDGDAMPTVIRADMSGVVHFETDGLENHLTPGLVDSWSVQWFRNLPSTLPQKAVEGRTEVGQPLFKIVDSLTRGLIALVDDPLFRSIDQGRRVGLRIGAQDGGLYPGRLTHMQRDSDHVLVYIVAEHLPVSMSISRKARVSLLFDSISGKVVPRSAIDVRSGLQGVWTMEASQSGFFPVKVRGGDASRVVIEAEIPPGTRIRRVAPSHPD